MTTISDFTGRNLTELLSLRGRAAVVTGGAQGLGRAIADRLAEAGADVMIGDIDEAQAQATASEIAARHGTRVQACPLDVRDTGAVEQCARDAARAFGGLDTWVNNAGVFPLMPVMKVTEASLDQVLQVNLRGVFAGCKAAARKMIDQGRAGVIVNIVSVSGFVARSPGVSTYVASKHSVRGLTRQLAIELAPHGIRVLGVAPALCVTEGILAGLGEDMRDRMTSRLGRVGVPDDVARAVLFCASDMAAFLTGSTLLVDAGEIA